ncbi:MULTISPECIES: CbtB domain-containing protein [Methylomonas]|uniref:CbtB-domain containing protein n=2 Tax=Methylomonas TaxID=416 RepID=A0ABY7GR27_9GAMM|nr:MULTISPECIES: CbtB domain-containing protein [Methylomonas]MDX8129978.1 CbtB domain-containing protein [Methylomonas sp. OY6]WAR46966.1 CbtB-domain containing protein [Methylomonas rapida]
MKTLTASTAIVSSKLLPGLSAIVLGLSVVLGLGFLQDANNTLHNAVHDGRHSAAFPCH